MLPVQLRVEHLKLNHMYNIISGTAPDYLSSQIVMVNTQHTYNTKASVRSCKVPRANNVARSSFFYTGILLWNSLPLSTKLAGSRGAYRGQVRAHLWRQVAT